MYPRGCPKLSRIIRNMFGHDFHKFAIALFLTMAVVSPAIAQGTIGEAFVSDGVSVRPGGKPALGGGFAGGWGERPLVSVAVGYSRLGDYALGVGQSVAYGTSITQSRLWSLDASFQLETIPRSKKSVVTPYVGAGAGLLFERFNAVPPTCCNPGAPPPPRREFDGHVFGPNFSAGLRVPVSTTLGIRPEVKVWIVRAHTGPYPPILTTADAFVTATVSF